MTCRFQDLEMILVTVFGDLEKRQNIITFLITIIKID